MTVQLASGSTLNYCYRCTNVGFVNYLTSAAPWTACKSAFTLDPLMPNHRQLHQLWVLEHRALQADWHQDVFSDESRFYLSDHDGRARDRLYLPSNSAFQSALSSVVLAEHPELWFGV